MQPIRLSLAVALALAPLAACEKDNPNFCGDGDQRPECTTDAMPIDAVEGCMANPNLCTTDEDCVDDICVDCTAGDDHQSAECTDPAAPVCGTNRDCRACAADAECDSQLCDHGRCAAVGSVLFVSTNGDDMGGNNPCNSPATPCRTLTRVIAVVPTPASDTNNLRYIRMMTRGTYAEPNAVTIADKNVVILGALVVDGERSVIDRSSNGPTMLINSNAVVRLERLGVVNGENNTAADGITCSSAELVADGIQVDDHDGTGIVGDSCELTLRNSIISTNREGGVTISGSARVVIVNNFIVDNGTNTSSVFGGLRIESTDPASVIQSNTVANNSSSGTDGVTCAVANLLVLNTIIIGDGLKPRVLGTCTFDHTLYGPDDPGMLLGTARGNMLVANPADFQFVASDDYHIKPTSVAKGKGTTTGLATEAATDADGQPRPQGMPDVGADEIPD